MVEAVRPSLKNTSARVRWVKEWVPQELVATGGRCLVLKWIREDALKALKEEMVVQEQEKEPEPTTETLFLCSYEGCGKTFFDVPSLKKHSHQVHHERQYVCQYEGCGKKFVDSSKLKRHNLIHTGVKAYVCPYEGCGKPFSLDFNLRAHMKTHLPENYHICPYVDCGKRFTHDQKLQAHIKLHHEKQTSANVTKRTSPSEKVQSAAANPPAMVEAPPSADRPYACPFEGCNKAYIHEYKLNLHLKREHPYHNADGNGGMEYDGKKTFACPFEGCSKSYQYEYKLNLHLKREHQHSLLPERPATYTPTAEMEATETSRRDNNLYRKNHVCPYEGCRKSYYHEYKLNLHLRKEHPGHNMGNGKHSRAEGHEDNDDEYEYAGNNAVERTKRFKPESVSEAHSSAEMIQRPPSTATMKQQWPANATQEEDSEDSEKTDEEDHDNNQENGWDSDEENEDDEETEDDED